MANLSNFIDENHYISFQNLSSVCKVSNITEAKDCHYFLSRYHDIDDGGILDNPTDNLSPSLSDTDCQ